MDGGPLLYNKLTPTYSTAATEGQFAYALIMDTIWASFPIRKVLKYLMQRHQQTSLGDNYWWWAFTFIFCLFIAILVLPFINANIFKDSLISGKFFFVVVVFKINITEKKKG